MGVAGRYSPASTPRVIPRHFPTVRFGRHLAEVHHASHFAWTSPQACLPRFTALHSLCPRTSVRRR
eukprot:2628788-Pleurochrysis_carterae.AAC.2